MPPACPPLLSTTPLLGRRSHFRWLHLQPGPQPKQQTETQQRASSSPAKQSLHKRRAGTRLGTLVGLLGALAGLNSCQSSEPYKYLDPSPSRPSLPEEPPEEECEGPPTPDTTELCSDEVVPLLLQKPQLYFLLDVSGSMNEVLDAPRTTKLSAAKQSILTVVSELGHRIHYGLATFPGADTPSRFSGCGPGSEIFPLQEGDPLLCTNLPPRGPLLESFTQRVMALRASGGTPLSASLQALSPQLLTLPGPAVLLLMTDGAPNCNPTAQCTAEECTLNLEGATAGGQRCDESLNCCALPDTTEEEAAALATWCVDSTASIEQLEQLTEAGISTYVIGVPGSELYASVMNRLAQAGGTARDAERLYYDVRDQSELTKTLQQISASVALSCEWTLAAPPPFPDLFNVYLDAQLLKQNPEDGWTLDRDQLKFHGLACSQVQSGEIAEIRLVSGCRTVVR